jgi:hypothetical protein
MATTNADLDALPQVVFRPGKKRKMYRQRADEPDETTSGIEHSNGNGGPTTEGSVAAQSTAKPLAEEDDHEHGLSVAEVLRLRNSRKHRPGGVGFRAGPSFPGDSSRVTSEENTEQSMVLHGNTDTQQGAEVAVIGGISKRFAPQTGLVGEVVNKHM